MGAGFMMMAAEQHRRRVSHEKRLRRIQRGLVEGKIAVGRAGAYTSVVTFLLVAFLWVDKAYEAWRVDMDYFAFMALVLAATFLLGIVWTLVDRRLIWPREQGITTGVNPLACSEAERSAWFIARDGDAEAEKRARVWFETANIAEEFDWWLGYWRERFTHERKPIITIKEAF